jgi:arylsulfatase A-like enzyme
MNRKIAFYTASVGLVVSASVFSKQKPNIIFIMSDDHAYQAISAYGSGLNHTPNIDRIANEGVLFNKAFVTNSISAPSRAVMLTGKFNHLNGKTDNQKSVYNWDQQNFVRILQQNGYQTAMIGKIHIDGNPQGFHYTNILPGQGQYYNPQFIENGVKKTYPGYVTTLTTQFALEWLSDKRDKSKPFCLLYHQKAPHRGWQPEGKYLNLFDDKDFKVPENFFDDYSGRGTAAKHQKMEIGRDMEWGQDMKFENDPFSGKKTPFGKELESRLDPDQLAAWRDAYNPDNEAFLNNPPKDNELKIWKYNRYIKDYLRCIQSVDDGVGEVLDYLKENGLEENTIVVYTSDQGFYLGEHGWFDKRFMYEESLRTPLLIRYPKEIKSGTVCDKLVQNIDFAATFLDYAGIQIPKDIQGESFRNIVSGKSTKWRDAIYYHYYEYPQPHSVIPHYGVRTERYKLIHFYGKVDEWELYDLEEDPREMKSVYDDPAYSSVCSQMHKKLIALQKKYKDQNPEAPL